VLCKASSEMRVSILERLRCVEMGTFYGGIAHVPVSSSMMVCELAGSYDLLVPSCSQRGIASLRFGGARSSRPVPPSESPRPIGTTRSARSRRKARRGSPIARINYVAFPRSNSRVAEVLQRLQAPMATHFPVLDGGVEDMRHDQR